MINPNSGSHPSKFELDRYASGELNAGERTALEGRMTEASRAHLADVEAARASTPALDVAALRRRAAAIPAMPDADGLPAQVATHAAAANDVRAWARVAPLLLLAAAILFAFLLPRWFSVDPSGPNNVQFRTGDALQVYQLDGTSLVTYAAGTAVGESDVLGFKVAANDHQGVVLLSVDGAGSVTVFFPAEGEAPEPLRGSGLVALPGTVILDGAPGPEVFVAVFDVPVSEAREQVQHTWQAGGAAAVLEWAGATQAVDAVEVTRR